MTATTSSNVESTERFDGCHTVHFQPHSRARQDNTHFPTPRSGHCMITCHLPMTDAIELRPYVYVFGGLGADYVAHNQQQQQMLNDMWRLDLATNVWQELTPSGAPPTGAFGRGHALLRDGRRWFIYGGISAHVVHLDCCQIYDLHDNTWTRVNLSSPLQRLWGHSISSVLLQGRETLVVIGGMEGEVCNGKIFYLHCERDSQWRSEVRPFSCNTTTSNGNRSALSFPLRRRHGSCVYRDVFILVAAGRNHYNFLNDMWALNTVTNQWVPLTAGATAVEVRAFFDNPSSRDAGLVLQQSMSRLATTLTPPTQQLSSMYPRTGLTMFSQGDLVYIFGGFYWSWHDSCSFSDMHVYDLTLHRWEGVVEANVKGEPDAEARRPHPTTMAAICPIPLPTDPCDNAEGCKTARGYSRWLLFGGRYANIPTNRCYTMHIYAKRHRLVEVASRWLRDRRRPDATPPTVPLIRKLLTAPPNSAFCDGLWVRFGRDADAVVDSDEDTATAPAVLNGPDSEDEIDVEDEDLQ